MGDDLRNRDSRVDEGFKSVDDFVSFEFHSSNFNHLVNARIKTGTFDIKSYTSFHVLILPEFSSLGKALQVQTSDCEFKFADIGGLIWLKRLLDQPDVLQIFADRLKKLFL